MSAVFDLLLRLAVWLILAPLLPGLVNKVKAWVAGRRGPPILQLYYDLAKLWRKGVVLSTAVSPAHVAGPAVAWIALAGAATLLPLGPAPSPVSFRGDALLFVYLLALARFCTAGAALDTGSAFEGMGAAREVSYAVLSEAAVIAALLALSLQTGSVSMSTMLAPAAGAGAALLAAGLFTVLLAENCRVPFDDPNTHLELTMIHEVMVLDHSGPPLAVILHGAALKLLVFSVLLTEAVLPMGGLPPLAAAGALGAAVLGVAIGVGLVESLLARFAFRRVPLLLTTALLLCLFAVLVAWKGGGRGAEHPISSSEHPTSGRHPGDAGGGATVCEGAAYYTSGAWRHAAKAPLGPQWKGACA
jgi:formate hydrogenlyase subunit 4